MLLDLPYQERGVGGHELTLAVQMRQPESADEKECQSRRWFFMGTDFMAIGESRCLADNQRNDDDIEDVHKRLNTNLYVA